MYVFGQAKKNHLNNPVETPQVDQLFGAITLIRRTGGTPTKKRIRKKLLDWGWERYAPLQPCLATSGRFTADIPGLAREQGFSILDGEQLAQRVILRKKYIRTKRDVTIWLNELSKGPKRGVTML